MPFIPPFGSPPGGAAGATTALDNLASVQINTDLVFADDAGSTEYFITVDVQAAANTAGNSLAFESGGGQGSGVGGNLSFFASSGGTTGDGGDILFSTGKGQGGGSDGLFKFQDTTSGFLAILDISSIATTDKTFTFPNTTGTFALTSDIPAAGATTALDNLASVQINTDLIPDADSTHDIGDSSNFFKDSYIDKVVLLTNVELTGNSNKFRIKAGTDTKAADIYRSGSVTNFQGASSEVKLINTGGLGLHMGSSDFIFLLAGGAVYPNGDSSINLGKSDKFWLNTYTDKLFLNSTATLDGATAGEIISVGNLRPSADNTADLGKTNLRYKDLYLAGNLKDDTASLTVANARAAFDHIHNLTTDIDHGGLSGLSDNDHTQYILHSLAGAANDFLIASGANTYIKKTLAETGAILEGDIVHDNLQSIPANDHLDWTGSVGTIHIDNIANSSPTAQGVVELAVASEVNTGTSTALAVSPDALAGSNYGQVVIGILVSDPLGDAITTGDGKAVVRIPAKLNTWDLTNVDASLSTVSSSGVPTIQVRRSRRNTATSRTDADMLSTRVTIDASEFDSNDAATPPVINGSNDDVNEDDQIFIDIDVAGTGAKGLFVELTFQLP